MAGGVLSGWGRGGWRREWRMNESVKQSPITRRSGRMGACGAKSTNLGKVSRTQKRGMSYRQGRGVLPAQEVSPEYNVKRD